MKTERYTLLQDQLIICDPELDIELIMPFDLPRLSEHAPQIQERDPEGNLRALYLVSEGRRHGQCRLFAAEEEKVRSEMFYLHGKLHGPSVMYGDRGEVLAETWYCDGKRIGKAKFYSPSGALLSLQRFKQGEWEGEQEYFYASGAIKSVIPFKLAKLHGQVRLFWEGGSSKRLVHYVDGLREGSDQLWNEQGILIDEGEYRAGKTVGVHRRYFADGVLQEERHYHTPLRFDRREWDPSGKLLLEGVFAPDLTYTERVYQGTTQVRKGVWDDGRIRWK